MEKSQICIWANRKEIEQIESIKEYHKRKTNSDTLRFLIQQEYEKIFDKNITEVMNFEKK